MSLHLRFETEESRGGREVLLLVKDAAEEVESNRFEGITTYKHLVQRSIYHRELIHSPLVCFITFLSVFLFDFFKQPFS